VERAAAAGGSELRGGKARFYNPGDLVGLRNEGTFPTSKGRVLGRRKQISGETFWQFLKIASLKPEIIS
jgi:hypothetical protein